MLNLNVVSHQLAVVVASPTVQFLLSDLGPDDSQREDGACKNLFYFTFDFDSVDLRIYLFNSVEVQNILRFLLI